MEIDEFHYHEMIDRLYMINSMIENFLLVHPVADEEAEVKGLIEDAQSLLSNAYQTCGRIEHEKFSDIIDGK